MSAADVLAQAQAAGVQLVADGDRLRFRAPAGALTPDLRATLQEHRAAVLKLLAERPPATDPRPALWWEQSPWSGHISDDEFRAIVAAYVVAHGAYDPGLPIREPAELATWLAARETSA
jgi:hypothetical protein